MNNEVKMIVSDLDGTLLKCDKSVSDFTLDTINRLRAKGYLFGIATARPVRAVKRFLPNLIYDFAIYHNGAVITDNDEFIEGYGINNLLEIVELIMKNIPGCHICLEAEDTLYSSFDSDKVWPGFEFVATKDFKEVNGKIGDKILVEIRDNNELQIIGSILPDYLYAQLSEGHIAMIMNKNATKARAVELIAKKHMITMNQVVSFGDDLNDICLLTDSGIGVAVDNALEVVKNSADYVCASNEVDGVAAWILNNILMK